MPRFAYLPLARHEIRLCRLLPASFDDEIRVEIFHEILSEEQVPKFEAVSYAWGSTRNSRAIIVSPASKHRAWAAISRKLHVQSSSSDVIQTLPVTQNLASALRHLRYRHTSRVLWIDAICINQENIPERNVEVGRMGLIYSKAAQTVVWLGPASENSDLAMRTLRSIGQDISYNCLERKLVTKIESDLAKLQKDPSAIANKTPQWRAIQDLLYRDWFTRLWVYQEIMLSQHPVMVVGFSEIPWSFFEAAAWWMRLTSLSSLTMGAVFDSDYFDEHVNGILVSSEGVHSSIIALLEDTRSAMCSDPRDRVYAVTSMYRGEAKIRPDYLKTKEQVYEDFTKANITACNALSILSRCELQNSSSSLPSWVPDLSIMKYSETLDYGLVNLRSAHRGHFSPLEKTLIVEGITVASIELLGTAVPNTNKLSEILAICRNWQTLVPLSGAYVGGGTMYDACVRTIICPYLDDDTWTLEEGRAAFSTFLQSGEVDGTDFIWRIWTQGKLRGRAFGTTTRGYIGLFPARAQVGDQICYILGSLVPLLFRPVSGHENHFQLVGECYVAGLSEHQALLGQLPDQWQFGESAKDGNRIYAYDGKTSTLKDPRFGALPPGWQIIYESGREMDDEGNLNNFWFENGNESTEFDPRLTKEVLIGRGVDVKEFVLV